MTYEEDNGSNVYKPAAPKLYCDYTGPGPLAYKLKPLTGRKDHDQTKTKAPAYSISLPIIALKHTGPAPGDYNLGRPGNLSTHKSAPAPIIGYRYNLPDYRCGPGPTAYSLPGTVGKGGAGSSRNRTPAAWSFKGRQEYGGPYWEGITKNAPGPSMYTCPEPSVYKKTFGSYSMQGRTQKPVYNTSLHTPAPGSYSAGETMGGLGKGPTMGTRHSTNVLVCLTMADTVY